MPCAGYFISLRGLFTTDDDEEPDASDTERRKTNGSVCDDASVDGLAEAATGEEAALALLLPVSLVSLTPPDSGGTTGGAEDESTNRPVNVSANRVETVWSLPISVTVTVEVDDKVSCRGVEY